MKVPGVDDPLCRHCEKGEEMTVEHVLIRCQRWSELRKECFRRAFGPGATPSLEGLLSTRKGSLAATRMVWETGLLAQFGSYDFEIVGEDNEEERGVDSAREGVDSAREGIDSAREGVDSARGGTEGVEEGTGGAEEDTDDVEKRVGEEEDGS